MVTIKQMITDKSVEISIEFFLFQADHLFYEKMGRSEEACIEVGNIVIKVIMSVESAMSL